MKAIVGIDAQGTARRALRLFNRFGFADPEIDFIHVVPNSSQPSGVEDARQYVKEFIRSEEEQQSLTQGKVATYTKPRIHVLHGDRTRELLSFADIAEADMICASANHEGALDCFVLGSVCRALTIGAKQSVLIAKGYENPNGTLRAVFATDHSQYAKECAEKLISWKPKGLSELTVLSVIKPIIVDPVSPEVVDAMLEAEHKEASIVEEKTSALASRFAQAGIACRSVVRKGFVAPTIADVMIETDSELLILGAQGHGFLERLVIGSVSLQEVVSEPFPVLVIRV